MSPSKEFKRNALAVCLTLVTPFAVSGCASKVPNPEAMILHENGQPVILPDQTSHTKTTIKRHFERKGSSGIPYQISDKSMHSTEGSSTQEESQESLERRKAVQAQALKEMEARKSFKIDDPNRPLLPGETEKVDVETTIETTPGGKIVVGAYFAPGLVQDGAMMVYNPTSENEIYKAQAVAVRPIASEMKAVGESAGALIHPVAEGIFAYSALEMARKYEPDETTIDNSSNSSNGGMTQNNVQNNDQITVQKTDVDVDVKAMAAAKSAAEANPTVNNPPAQGGKDGRNGKDGRYDVPHRPDSKSCDTKHRYDH